MYKFSMMLTLICSLLLCASCTVVENDKKSGNGDGLVQANDSVQKNLLLLANIEEKNTIEFFISPSGNDRNTGDVSKPLASLQEAINRLNDKQKDVAIYLREGTYRMQHASLTSKNINAKSLTISNYENEKIILSGGVALDGRSFKEYNGGNNKGIHYIDLPSELHDKADEISKLNSTGFYETKQPIAMELFFNHEPLSLARYPNSSLIKIEKVIYSDSKKLKKKSTFRFDPNVKLDWAQTDDIWIGGQFSVGWINNNFLVDSLNQASNTIITRKTPYQGIYATFDNSTEILKSSQNLRGFYFFNVFDALDNRGEWFYDKKKKQIFVCPPANISKASVELSVLGIPLINIADNNIPLQINGINFESVRGTALEIANSKNVMITNCSFSNIGLEAIKTDNCYNIEINSCQISNTGADGIFLSGGNRKTLASSNIVVKNCEIHNFSRIFRSYSPAIRMVGVGHKIIDCHIHDSPGQAIIFSGNDHLIQGNLIENVCKEFTDMGGVYTGNDPSSTGTMIKNNVFRGIKNDKSKMIAAIYLDDGNSGINIEDNIFINSGSSLFGAITINGGSFNELKNNTFINCDKAYYAKYWSNALIKQKFFDSSVELKKFTETVDIRTPVYTKRYPHLVQFMNYDKVERKNPVSGSKLINVKYLGLGEGFKSNESLETVSKTKLDENVSTQLNRWKIAKKTLGL